MRHTTHQDNAAGSRRFQATPRVQEVLREQGRKQTWLAAKLEMTPPLLCRILSGERKISEDDGRVLAALLQTDFGVLFELSPDKRCSSHGKRSDGQ